MKPIKLSFLFLLMSFFGGCLSNDTANLSSIYNILRKEIPLNYSFYLDSTMADSSSLINEVRAGGDACNDMIVDNDGSIYCAGITDSDLVAGSTIAHTEATGVILKLDVFGQIVWIKEIDDVNYNNCLGIAVDDKFVYCGGRREHDDQITYQLMVYKYDKVTGEFITSLNFPPTPGSSERCQKIAVDDQFVYCGGHEKAGSSRRPFIVKLNKNDLSNVLSGAAQKHFVEPQGIVENGEIRDILVDNGDVYVAGVTAAQGSGLQATGAFIYKWSVGGTKDIKKFDINVTGYKEIKSIKKVPNSDTIYLLIEKDAFSSYEAKPIRASTLEDIGGSIQVNHVVDSFAIQGDFIYFAYNIYPGGGVIHKGIGKIGYAQNSNVFYNGTLIIEENFVCQKLDLDLLGNLYCGGWKMDANDRTNNILIKKIGQIDTNSAQ